MANQKINGGDMMIFLNGKSIALATSHTLDISGETLDTSNKDTGGGKWSSSEVSSLSWSGTSENLFSADGADGATYDTLFGLMVGMNPVDFVFAAKAGADAEVKSGGWTPSAVKYLGKANITKLSTNAPNGEYATFTVEFTGVGALTKVGG